MIDYVILIAIFVIFIAGALIHYHCANLPNLSQVQYKFKKNRYRSAKELIAKEFESELKTNILSDTAFFIPLFWYQVVRFFILVMWVILLLYNKFILSQFQNGDVITWLLVFIMTSPKPTFMGRKSFMYHLIDFLKNDYRNKKNKEIYRAISQLKNLSIAKAESKVSAFYIIEELNKYTKITKAIFNRTLSYWYENRKEDAVEYFSNSIDTKEGRQLAQLFIKMDNMNPVELIEQFELFQNTVRETRKTESQKKREFQSNVIFTVVLATATLMLINFVVVVIVIDSLNYYQNLQIK